MAKIWRNRIEAGDQQFEDCPARYKPQVLALMRQDVADGIITADKTLAQRIVAELAEEAPVRYFAGRDQIVTAVYQPAEKNEAEEGLTDVSWLTHPFFVATDVLRNRVFYDEARQNPLPKLFRDKRDERKRDEAPQANANIDNTEQAL